MVTLRPGRDPDKYGLEDYEAPNYAKSKTLISVVVGALLTVVCIPLAALFFVFGYSATHLGKKLGIDTGLSTYWLRITASLAITPLRPFNYFFVPNDLENPFIPDDLEEEAEGSQ